jgi:hypothetical protein
MSRWRRVDPISLIYFVSLGFLLLGGLFIAILTSALLSYRGRWELISVLVFLGGYGFIAFWLRAVWRFNRAGIYVGDSGVRVVTYWKTHVLSRIDIAEVVVAPATLGRPTRSPREAIWLRTRDGHWIETAVQRYDGPFPASGGRFHGPVLGHVAFDATLRALRQAIG